MKSFESVYNTKRRDAINEQRLAADADKAKLVAAIKKEYGVNDFCNLSESEKMSFRTLINEMWNRETGLNERGKAFLNESVAPLTEKSTDEQIEKFAKKTFKANADWMCQNLIMGKQDETIVKVKKQIEEQAKKKLSVKTYRQWIFDVLSKHLASKIKDFKF